MFSDFISELRKKEKAEKTVQREKVMLLSNFSFVFFKKKIIHNLSIVLSSVLNFLLRLLYLSFKRRSRVDKYGTCPKRKNNIVNS